MRRLVILLLAPLLMAQDYNVPFRPRAAGGGGGTCASPDNFLASTAHLYFHADNSWAVAGDPDDEGSGTDQALETSTNLTEGDDLVACTTGCPAGTPTTNYRVVLTGAETAISATHIFKASQFGDWTACAWVKPITTENNDLWGSSDNGSSLWMYAYALISTDGRAGFHEDPGSLLETGASQIANGTWVLFCQRLDANGATGGTQNRSILINGALQAVPTDLDAETDMTPSEGAGLRVDSQSFDADIDFEAMDFVIFHSALSDAQINELCCCGLNGEANPTDREAVCGGTACSTF